MTVPVAVGAPVIVPAFGSRLSPFGSEPTVIAHVSGAVEPGTLRVVLYQEPTTPFGRVVGVMASGGPIVMLAGQVAVSAGDSESTTCRTKFDAPVALGVPVMAPVDALKESPAGNEPDESDQAYGAVPPVKV